MKSKRSLREEIERLGPWFHNIHLPGGEQTAPDHFLGDFPKWKWQEIKRFIPSDLRGWKCLDIGCNGGFYCLELAKRGADVLGIDFNPQFVKQGDFAARALGLEKPPRFVHMQVHDLARLNQTFDLVLFLGVFYHLRYPALALDTVSRMVKRLMFFQSLGMDPVDDSGEPPELAVEDDYSMNRREVLHQPGWPKMAFIERRFQGDFFNWWIPNHAAITAMLRSTGFKTVRRIATETYVCKPPAGGVEQNRIWNTHEWYAATGNPPPAEGRVRKRRRSGSVSSKTKPAKNV
jgi:tRNA (mo5U34)-methyltransferase